MPKGNNVDLDNILLEVGQCGRYQVITYSFILWPILFSAVYNGQYIFAACDLDYRCKVPQCESNPPKYETNGWGAWALPPPSEARCQRMRPVGSGCSAQDFHPNDTVACTSWVYADNNSIVTEFNLACQDLKRTMVGTVHSIGLFVALPITAYISDGYGRRTAFILTAVSVAVMGLIRSFSPNYYFYLVFEFLDATVGSGVYSSGYILALEMVGLDRRVFGGNIISCTYAAGSSTLALFAWTFPYWKTLTRVIYTPSLLFIFYYFCLEESVRWLLSKGRKAEAARILFEAARINNNQLKPESIKQLTNDTKELSTRSLSSKLKVQDEQFTKKIFKSKIMISRLCICSFWWITVTFIYYGLSINSVSLAGNRYVNYILTSFVEIPGYCISILVLDRFGRKPSLMAAYFLCGGALLLMITKPRTWLKLTLNLFGKLCISTCFSSIYIFTLELFPTVTRHSSMGICSAMGRFGTIFAMLTPLLMKYSETLPYIIFGAMAGTSALLMLLMPETNRLRLPDTVEQAESMAVPHTKRPHDILVD